MNKLKRYSIPILIDTIIILISAAGSSFLLYGSSPKLYTPEISYIFLLFWLTFIGGFYYVKLYSRDWRYFSIDEMKLIIKVSILSFIIVLFTQMILNRYNIVMIPIPMFLLGWMGIIFGIFTSRLIIQIFQENHGKLNTNGKKILIVGSGNAGILVLKELRKSMNSPLYPVGFIDDDPDKLNLHILGVPVIGTRKDIAAAVKQYKIEMIIIALPSAPKAEILNIVNICKENNVQVKILPRISDIFNGRIAINMIREVKIEDLLGRPPIELDSQGIAGYVTDKIVLVTGAGGSIGSEICRQVSRFNPKKLLLLGHGETSIYTIENELKRSFPHIPCEAIIADIQDRKRIENIFSFFRPNVIFHAAAHKHVPLMEYNPTEAIKNNVFGTKNIAECAHQFGAEQLVLISTDKAVNPTSVMGVTKRIAELIIQTLNAISSTKFVAVRFGNVLGSRGSVIPLFKQQIQEGGPITVTHPDMTRYFMTIPEAVQLVIQAGALAKGGEIFILDMGQPVKISDLARDLITLSGLTPDQDIKIEYTGIRPGEKLYEEILTSEEKSMASKHQLIYVAKPTDLSQINLSSSLEKLKESVHMKETQQRISNMKSILKEIVPTYQTEIHVSDKDERFSSHV